MRLLSPFAAALLVLLGVAGAAEAFASVKPGASPHDRITSVATAGWPEDATRALQDAVRQADINDFSEEKRDGEKRLVATPLFRPSHHCDRVPPATDADAFAATVAYVHEQRNVTVALALVDPEAAMRALGRALHAFEDCFSHTNVVDLDAAAQTALRDALLHGGTAPAGLLVMGSDPAAPEIGLPPGDPYPHDLHNRDDPGSSPDADLLDAAGRTKHEAAAQHAEAAAAAFVGELLEDLEPDATAALLDVETAGDSSKPPKANIPASGLLAVALAVGVVLARRA